MSTPINVQSSAEALDTILEHHAALRRELSERVRDLQAAVEKGAEHQQLVADLTGFLTNRVLPHAISEEATLYAAAAEEPSTTLLVEAMTTEHRALAERFDALAEARSAVEAAAVAEAIATLFALHVHKENEVLLPALSRAPGVNLAALLHAMHHHEDHSNAGHDEAVGANGGVPAELDVRALPHGPGRHEAIFTRLAALPPGGTLVIVNDHDPIPLRYQIDAAWPDVFTWEYLEAGPRQWRVAITR